MLQSYESSKMLFGALAHTGCRALDDECNFLHMAAAESPLLWPASKEHSMHSKTIAYQFGLCSYVLERNIGGVSHEESLVSPQPGGNCLNWVVGHLTRARNRALGLFGQKALFPNEEFNSYDDNGGVPFDAETAISFDELKHRFKALQEPLVNGLNGMSAEAMDQPAPFSPTGNPKETVGSLLAAMAFHEAYHVGQTGMLRRVVGREGVIKPPKIPATR
jgi:uncharacterized damage-inducible protein DinB